jgi:DNA repair protein RadC
MHGFLYAQQNISGTQKPDIREKILEYGTEKLSNQELLAAILGNGTRGRSVRKLARDITEALERAPEGTYPERFMRLNGVGTAKACQIAAALELGKRFYGTRERHIKGPCDVFAIIAHWADRNRERFIVLSLNGAHELIKARIVTIGLVNRTVVHPREVFADAVSDRACAVVLAHNHPSGKLEPSQEDIDITIRLKEAGKVLGISVIDHVIFSHENYASFVEKGFFEPEPP